MTVTFDFDAANQFENISSFDNQTKTKSSLIWFVTHRTTEIRRKSIPSQDNHQLDRVFENSTQLEVMLALNYFDSHRTKMVIVVSERNRNKNGTNFTRGTRKKNSPYGMGQVEQENDSWKSNKTFTKQMWSISRAFSSVLLHEIGNVYAVNRNNRRCQCGIRNVDGSLRFKIVVQIHFDLLTWLLSKNYSGRQPKKRNTKNKMKRIDLVLVEGELSCAR